MKTITILIISIMLLGIASAGLFASSITADLSKEQTDVLKEKGISKLSIIGEQDSKAKYYSLSGDINKPLITLPKKVCKLYDGKKICRDLKKEEINAILDRLVKEEIDKVAPKPKTAESRTSLDTIEVVIK